jgi:hypothetical protein
MNGLRMGKNLVGRGHGLLYDTAQTFAWRGLGNPHPGWPGWPVSEPESAPGTC